MRFKFSVKTLLVVVALLAGIFAIYGDRLRTYSYKLNAIGIIQWQGGTVSSNTATTTAYVTNGATGVNPFMPRAGGYVTKRRYTNIDLSGFPPENHWKPSYTYPLACAIGSKKDLDWLIINAQFLDSHLLSQISRMSEFSHPIRLRIHGPLKKSINVSNDLQFPLSQIDLVQLSETEELAEKLLEKQDLGSLNFTNCPVKLKSLQKLYHSTVRNLTLTGCDIVGDDTSFNKLSRYRRLQTLEIIQCNYDCNQLEIDVVDSDVKYFKFAFHNLTEAHKEAVLRWNPTTGDSMLRTSFNELDKEKVVRICKSLRALETLVLDIELNRDHLYELASMSTLTRLDGKLVVNQKTYSIHGKRNGNKFVFTVDKLRSITKTEIADILALFPDESEINFDLNKLSDLEEFSQHWEVNGKQQHP